MRIVGIGLDKDDDGCERLTVGDQFRLFEGSEASHREMQVLVLKIDRLLRARGRSLADVGEVEFRQLLKQVLQAK